MRHPDPYGWELPFTLNLRIKLFLTGILFPAFSIGSGLSGTSASLEEPWQSGTLQPYVVLFLQAPGLLCFLPLIIFSATALGAIAWRPENVRRLWVRIGLYSGAILSLQYIIAVALTSYFFSFFAAAIVGPSLAFLMLTISEFAKRIHRFTIFHLLIATAVAALVMAVVAKIWQAGNPEGLLVLVTFPLLAIFIAAPMLNFVTYTRMAIFAATHEPVGKTIPLASSLLAWIAGFGIAWRFSIIRVLDEYQNLPTTNPNCFIASAAANGSPRLVRSTFVDGKHGPVLLNKQMQRLKFLELTFKATFPRGHRFSRIIYNKIGPLFAKHVQSSTSLANAAYLFLTPLELAAETTRRLANISTKRIARLYCRHDQ